MNKVKVLLVEDKPSDVRLVEEAFKETKINCELSVVYDGEEAVNYLFKKGEYRDKTQPDLIILDIKIPKKNGHEVLKEIKSSATLKEVPVVMLTNSDARDDIQDSYEHQANSYITKPLHLGEFIEIIKYVDEMWLNPKRK